MWKTVQACNAASAAEIQTVLGQAASAPVSQTLVGSTCDWTLAKGGHLRIDIGPLDKPEDFVPTADHTHPWQLVTGLGQQADYSDEKSGAMLDQADRHVYVLIPNATMPVQLVVEVNKATPDLLPGKDQLIALAHLVSGRLGSK